MNPTFQKKFQSNLSRCTLLLSYSSKVPYLPKNFKVICQDVPYTPKNFKVIRLLKRNFKKKKFLKKNFIKKKIQKKKFFFFQYIYFFFKIFFFLFLLQFLGKPFTYHIFFWNPTISRKKHMLQIL